jgi:glucosyl-3-phosphoglycerate synthase
MFASVLERAFEEFQNHPFGSPLIPEWRRIEVALDGVLPELAAAFDNPNSRVTTRSGLRLEA